MNKIIIYQSKDKKTQIDVKFEHDTVWLTQQQMAELFGQTKQNISLHINNCFKEKELRSISVVKESLTTAVSSNSPSLKILRTCRLIFCFVFLNPLTYYYHRTSVLRTTPTQNTNCHY